MTDQLISRFTEIPEALYFPGPKGSEKRPLMVICSSFDSTLEELYVILVAAGLEQVTRLSPMRGWDRIDHSRTFFDGIRFSRQGRFAGGTLEDQRISMGISLDRWV